MAGRERDRFADGAWLAELAPLADGGSVAPAVAAALQMQQRHATTIEQTVVEQFATRSLLLVLDNCEHVLDAAARLVQRIVAECPGVVVLATSREPLGVDGEQVWPVPPLPPPDAATLFVLRARATRPDFEPDGGAVAEICRRLDGLPLGIELAAARTRAMSAAEIAERLDDGHLLARAARTAQPRHQSIAAAIDWPYRLPDEPEQRLFARMSAFGGADLAALHAVCGEPGTTPSGTLDRVAALVDKSMVVAVEHAGVTRYRMLETLRAYARERARRHRAAARRVLRRPRRGGRPRGAGRRRARLDRGDAAERRQPPGRVRARLRRARRRPRLAAGRGAARAYPCARHVRGRRVGPAVADLADPGHPLFAAAVGTAARGAWGVGDFARADALAALAPGCLLGAVAGRSGHPADVAADVALYRGDVTAAEAHYTSEVERARREGDRIRLVWTLYYVAICRAVRRVPEAGVAAAQEALAVARETGNPSALSMGHYALGLVLKKSHPDQALALLDEAARLAAEVQNFWWEGIALMEAAATRAVHGDPAEGAAALVVVLDHWDHVGDWTQQWLNLRYVVRLLTRLGAEHEATCCTTPCWPRASRHPSRRQARASPSRLPRPSRWPGRPSPATGS